MRVNFYNFEQLHNNELQQKILSRFEEIVTSNGFVEGKYNLSFEERFAKIQQAKQALLVANGTDALEIALQAYDIKPNEKVGIAAISFFATAECVLNRGSIPVFIDIDPSTGLMCPESLKRILAKHDLKAIIPVHIYGLPAPIEMLEKICHERDIKIIEDGAQGQGGFYQERKTPIGSSNNLTTFSFYPTKNLGAFGDAGALTTHDSELAATIRTIRNHGRSQEGHTLIGRNSRCDHLQAAVLDAKLDKLEEQNQMRKLVAKKYLEALSSTPLELVDSSYIDSSSWHLFPVRTKTKEEKIKLIEHLEANNIQCRLFYEKSLPQEAPLKHFEGEVEKANHFADTTFTIPMHPFLTDDEIRFVAEKVKNFFK